MNPFDHLHHRPGYPEALPRGMKDTPFIPGRLLTWEELAMAEPPIPGLLSPRGNAASASCDEEAGPL